ncbi:hypothetical protein GCM10022224_094850 [Nonomuraea antimicrobica]|uniref:Uncharacterized protein n=1 Tax=Nonomuraea antimicrobica TaxID=561173 RepID=A0ABP7E7J7_9ACTN
MEERGVAELIGERACCLGDVVIPVYGAGGSRWGAAGQDGSESEVGCCGEEGVQVGVAVGAGGGEQYGRQGFAGFGLAELVDVVGVVVLEEAAAADELFFEVADGFVEGGDQ